jgi:hypothetical protein
MKLTEYCDALNLELKVVYYPNQKDRWSASLPVEVKDGGFLTSTFGNGTSPFEAIDAYIKKIKGKTIVFGAYTNERREYVVPSNLTLD